MSAPDDALDFDLAAEQEPRKERLHRPQDKPIEARRLQNPEDMHNEMIQFGKHKGERWTRLPVGYLKWMSNQLTGEGQRLADLELERRGSIVEPTIELSGHAIDRASIYFIDKWLLQRSHDKEGFHTWLAKTAQQAYDIAEVPPYSETSEEPVTIKVKYNGMKLAIMVGRHYPVLKTVMPTKEDQRRGTIRINTTANKT